MYAQRRTFLAAAGLLVSLPANLYAHEYPNLTKLTDEPPPKGRQ